ncbi:MAG: hypothetical protein QN178_14200 [Armatimonadota bacterium]|nr:hypothetical protein [Armatimonadota bacterium]
MGTGTVVLVSQAGLGVVGPADQAFGMEMLEKFLHVELLMSSDRVITV